MGPAAQTRRSLSLLGALAAQNFVHPDPLCGKSLVEDGDASIRIGRSAHEYIERGIACVGPGVNRNVTFRQHGHAGHAVRREMMNVNVQQRRARDFNAASQGRFDMLDVIEPPRAVQIDDQMHARTTHAITNREMALAVPNWRRSGHFEFGLRIFLSSGAWDSQALSRSQEGVLAHAVPNQK